MSTDKLDPSNKNATISSADDLAKTTNKSDVEFSEEELKQVREEARRRRSEVRGHNDQL